ncbi:MAG: FecR domain-containing protein [Odoribacteraceae bacterium]|jgi:ferric-dicitrate binding protein FerR (iron transport regulator)|nr:FecR domain-containing protein [Odoribacteraceae bacterium]
MKNEENNERAARLISTFLLGRASEDEVRELARWRAASEENERLFRECLAGRGFGRAYRVYRSVDWRRPYRRFARATATRRWTRAARYAAALLLPLVAALAWYLSPRQDNDGAMIAAIHPGHARAVLTRSTGERYVLDEAGEEVPVALPSHIRRLPGAERLEYGEAPAGEVARNRMETPRGGEYRLTLPDGSRVHLNARSSLEYPEAFRGEAREVRLEGEAWFEVAADAARPFIVASGAARVRVHGTRFNVNASREGDVLVALASGSVGLAVEGEEGETLLAAGQVGEYRAADGSVTARDADLLPHVGWKDNLFVFSGEPLGGILERLGDWYDFSVAYADDRVAATRFSLVMKRYDDISVILEAIEKTAGVTLGVSGRTIVVSPGKRDFE